MGSVKAEDVLELTFAKVYGEIDHYTFEQTDIFAKLCSLRLISREERRGQKYETRSDKNR